MKQILVQRKNEKIQSSFLIREETSDLNSILEVYKKNSYQRKEFKIGSGNFWLDGGANIGSFSVYCAALGNKVISIEPEDENIKVLEKNMHLNGFLSQTIKAIISEDDGVGDEVDFYVNKKPMALRRHSIYKPLKNFEVVKKKVLKYDDLLKLSCNCWKLNIEGAEIQLLEKKSFGHLKKLVFEYSFDKDRSIPRFRAILDKLKKEFKYLDINKKLPPKSKIWDFYPPNIFVFAMN